MNVYLSGMIGSGKTTLGRRLAQKLERPFFDLDEEMNRLLGYSFHDLVKNEGWLAFRELEYTICKSFARRTESIVCLGGGTVRYEWNRDALRGTGVTVLLEVAPEELVRRVRSADRPRVNAGTTLEEDINLMWTQERDKYFEAADVVYRAEGKEIETEVEEIIDLLRAERRMRVFFEVERRKE